MPNDTADANSVLQMQVCERLKVDFVGSPAENMIGLGEPFDAACGSVHGLRRQINANETGWYIWTGDYVQEDVGFFYFVRVEEFSSLCPAAVPYLGLAPGWRFTIKPGKLDVRFDRTLVSGGDASASDGQQSALANQSNAPAGRSQATT